MAKNVRLKDSSDNILYPQSDSKIIIHADTTVYDALEAVIAAAAKAQDTADSKQDPLTAGTGIAIEGTTISCTLDTTVAKVVSSLPDEPDEADKNKIFFVPAKDEGTNNKYIEYLWVNDAWEELGEYKTDIDLTDYLKKEDAESIYAKITDLNTVSNTASSAYNTANSAYNAANGAQSTADDAYTKANSAYDLANSAYNASNNAVTNVSASGTSPLTLSVSKSGTIVAISGSVDTYNKATIDDMISTATAGGITNITASATSPLTLTTNVSGTTATISGSVDLSDYATQDDLNAVSTTVNNAYNQANSAYSLANTANGTANNANTTAHSAYNQANSAYDLANSANTLANSANALANTANGRANSAYNQANDAYNVANTAQTTASTAANQASDNKDAIEQLQTTISLMTETGVYYEEID